MQLEILKSECLSYIKKLTTYEIEDELWFVTDEITDLLGISSDEAAKLDYNERHMKVVQTDGYFKNISLISESGLHYLLICSKKDFAITFKRWVAKDIIPFIRKADFYTSRKDYTILIF